MIRGEKGRRTLDFACEFVSYQLYVSRPTYTKLSTMKVVKCLC
jgi:hypothetical protein